VDTTLLQFLNETVRDHPLLGSVIAGFANWGVLAFGLAVCGLWLLDQPSRSGVWRLAAATALASAALAMLVNQVVSHLWSRPRPYASHVDIVPLLSPSADPSFPSDHAAAAFGIAVGILLVHRRAGRLFLLWATLIAASRVLAGMHYPSDVIAGAAIGAVSAFAVVRLAGRPLQALVRLASTITDPVLAGVRSVEVVARTVGSPAVRSRIVIAVGGATLAVFAYRLRAHLLDEMPLTVLALWALVVVLAAHVANRSATSARAVSQERRA
jgi:membrane-associated phospholipid phosphatase